MFFSFRSGLRTFFFWLCLYRRFRRGFDGLCLYIYFCFRSSLFCTVMPFLVKLRQVYLVDYLQTSMKLFIFRRRCRDISRSLMCGRFLLAFHGLRNRLRLRTCRTGPGCRSLMLKGIVICLCRFFFRGCGSRLLLCCLRCNSGALYYYLLDRLFLFICCNILL